MKDMDELIKWLKDVGTKVSAYPDELYKAGVELCGKYSKNRAIMATFRVGRPTPLHKKLLRNTLMRTAALLERRDAADKTTSAPAEQKKANSKKKADRILPSEKTKTKTPTKKPAKSKKTVSRKPTQSKKSAKGTQK